MFGREHLRRAIELQARLDASIEAHNRLNHEMQDKLRAAEERARDLDSHAKWEQTLRLEQERELKEARAEAHDLDKKNAILMERLDLVANYGMGGVTKSSGPKTMPEEVEDAFFQYRAGLLDVGALEETLAQAGFDHTEIEFDAGNYPRLSTKQ